MAAAILAASAANGQCVGQWLYPIDPPAVDGSGAQVSASINWNAGGAGSPQVLVVGGTFTSAGGVTANNIAYWDGTNWNALGPGFDDGAVNALAVLPNGDLVAAGNFTTSGGNAVSHIALWDPAVGSWAPIGSGLSNQVFALAALPNGDLLAGGIFTAAIGTTPAINRIARWNATTGWTSLGGGVTTGSSYVNAIAVLPSGNIVVGGARFTQVSNGTTTVSASRIAMWNPTTSTWSALSTGMTAPTALGVNSLLVMSNGDLIAGGAFTGAGGVAGTAHIARWDGAAWHALGVGLKGVVSGTASGSALTLAAMPNGDVVAGGSFVAAGNTTVGDVAAQYAARWNGTAWAPLDADQPDSNVIALTVMPHGVLAAGGAFNFLGSNLSPFLAEHADCVGACCQSDGSCTLGAGSPTPVCASGALTPGGSCSPSPCTVVAGVCCRGATCNSTITQSGCAGDSPAGAIFVSSASACNTGGSTTTPCCYADYNKSGTITVGDIFDYLNSWFAGSLYAKVGGDGTSGTLAVSDIFDFLNAWFAGGC
jgi:hypothetical protein